MLSEILLLDHAFALKLEAESAQAPGMGCSISQGAALLAGLAFGIDKQGPCTAMFPLQLRKYK